MKTLQRCFQTPGISLLARTAAVRLLASSILLTSACALIAQANAPKQANDEDYTKKIKEYLTDSRITTELVDHMPASDNVPSPLKFFGRIPGHPGELTIPRTSNATMKILPRPRRARNL